MYFVVCNQAVTDSVLTTQQLVRGQLPPHWSYRGHDLSHYLSIYIN